jgi:hypothetical protein
MDRNKKCAWRSLITVDVVLAKIFLLQKHPYELQTILPDNYSPVKNSLVLYDTVTSQILYPALQTLVSSS